MKHSPEIELRNARRERALAEQDCAHWDFEHSELVADCCYRLADATRRHRNAIRAVSK